MKKHITIITTGGTIAMKEDPKTGALVPAVSGEDLAGSVPGLTDWADIEVKEFSNLPSEFMTVEKMRELGQYIDQLAQSEETDGFVITHGTDTLEETAFYLENTLYTEKPVVITGAMRGASDLSADGPANILAAVRTAADEGAKGQGVLAVLNDTIHAAWDVTKSHSTRLDTFQSREWGPVGQVYSHDIVFGRRVLRHPKLHPTDIAHHVWLVKCAAGIEGDILRAAEHAMADGVVVEGFGCGNVPLSVNDAIHELLESHMPVVLVSRTGSGSVEKEYGYEGGAAALEKAGCILGGNLSGQKARILLMLALGAKMEKEDMRKLFQ